MAQLNSTNVLGHLSATGNLTVAGNSIFNGTLVIANTADAAAGSASGALRIGSVGGEHLAIDGNEIMAKSNSANSSTLYLNNEGGLVQVGPTGLKSSGQILAEFSQSNSSSSHIGLVEVKNTISDPGADFFSGMAMMSPNLSRANTAHIFLFGKARSTKNSGYIGYRWSDAGSNDNAVTIGHWGVDNVLTVMCSGNVGIGTLSPTAKLDVQGTGYFDNDLKVKGHVFAYNYGRDGGNAPALIFDKPGGHFTGIGAHTDSDTIWFGAVNSDGTWKDDYIQTWKFNGYLRPVKSIISETDESSIRMIYTAKRNAGMKYDYGGRESLIISAGTYPHAGISFYTANELGTADVGMNDTHNQWNSSVPTVHMLKKSLAINYNLTSDPTYNLYVNGTSYFNGNIDVNGNANATTLSVDNKVKFQYNNDDRCVDVIFI